jgi:hypothetical protein
MKKICLLFGIIFLAAGFFMICPEAAEEPQAPKGINAQTRESTSTKALLFQKEFSQFVKDRTKMNYDELFPPRTGIEKVMVSDNIVQIFFNREITDYPLRPETIRAITDMFKPLLESLSPGASQELFVGERKLEDYIPPCFRERKVLAREAPAPSVPPWIRRASSPVPAFTAGLYGRQIVLWGSHGWFYDTRTDLRWEWQRPRMFTIVEDLLPTSFMLPFILPMLENAGAVACYLRERDVQTHEALVDDADGNSSPQRGVFELSPPSSWVMDDQPGFQNGLAPYPDNLNPHEKGCHHVCRTADAPTARARWIPMIPEPGRYAVYVSYNMNDSRADDAHYIVYHLGGRTDFLVNQKMGGNTWVYLGMFLFPKGANPEKGSVELTNESAGSGQTVSADCVKFGGGMGDILRAGRTSGYPRYCEGSRYWLQYAGVKPELVYKFELEHGPDGQDYTEDYVSRAEYVNFLKGAPCGPNQDRNFPGLHVPVDLALGFHTDAGIKDGIFGTLSIYTEKDEKKQSVFPDGKPRLDDNRMLADLIQTQIVDDLRARYTSTWTRRRLADSNYSESRRGNVPSSLLELLSHQNFNDMKYANDPRFRFDVSRAIYKAMLRFVAFKNGYEPVIQPLSPTHLRVIRQADDSPLIEWREQPDPLEPSAVSLGYIVYTRVGDNEMTSDFDNGMRVTEPRFAARNLDPEKIYSFRVTAYNAGGESFPSEVLCIRVGSQTQGKRRILVVNAFDRIAPPSMIIKEGYSGFDRVDRGVGYMANFGLSGDTWDFNTASEFRTNDAPGHGASHGDLETKLELGNTFDFSIRHGDALASSGFGFDSSSDEAVNDGLVDLKSYALVDWLLGEERTTPPPSGFTKEGSPDRMKAEFKTLGAKEQELIASYLAGGGALFISGAYVATDLAGVETATDQDKKFLTEILKVYWTTNSGSRTNDVFAALEGPFKNLPPFHVSQGIGEDGVYGVELPDALKPAVPPEKVKDFETSETVFRYKDNGWSAAIAMKKPRKLVVFGFPFECIVGAEKRSIIMKQVVDYLLQQ